MGLERDTRYIFCLLQLSSWFPQLKLRVIREKLRRLVASEWCGSSLGLKVLGLSFWAMKALAKFIPKAFGYFAGVVSSETKKYGGLLDKLQDMITVLRWVIISFVLFEVLFSTSADGNTPYQWMIIFKKVLGAILVSTIIFTVEKTLLQLISISYHAQSFNSRNWEIETRRIFLGILFDACRTLFPVYGKDFEEEDRIMRSYLEAFMKQK